MADEKVFLRVGDLIGGRATHVLVVGREAYRLAKDVLELIGVDPNMTESELREKLGTTDG